MPFSEIKEKQQDRAIAANRDSIVNKPVMSGQVGTALHVTAPVTIKFGETWVDQGGITYNAGTGEFTVPEDGVYRITMNPFKRTGAGATRVYIGINNLTPGGTTHRGHCYSNSAVYDTMCLNSIEELSAGDKISFYLQIGQLYNASSDRFNQYTIEKIN